MFESIVLGIVQGVTEFFPISSTAHLILFPWLFEWNDNILHSLSFDVALHGGTLLALIVYFRRDWISIIMGDLRLLILLLIGTIPAALAGVLFKDMVSSVLRSPLVITIALVGVGLIMLVAERAKTKKVFAQIGIADAIQIGLAQALALIPGVSRSGITISAGLFREIKREDAARFSFMLSMPVVAGAMVLEIPQIMTGFTKNADIFIAGFLASFLMGLFSIHFLLRFFRAFSLRPFVYYRFLLAVIIMVAYYGKA